MRKPIHYPMGSISSGTMRPEDLIPAFLAELEWHSGKTRQSPVSAKSRAAHRRLVREIGKRMEADGYYESEDVDSDLESLFDALGEYAAPYFYFGAHPGDGADYGFWLSESWDEDFIDDADGLTRDDNVSSLKVSDLADVPKWFRGEVAIVTDHGNVTLGVQTSRGFREIWRV